jgi:hypothetical protein
MYDYDFEKLRGASYPSIVVVFFCISTSSGFNHNGPPSTPYPTPSNAFGREIFTLSNYDHILLLHVSVVLFSST